ncbi:hypothetical protein J6S88_07635 [bacterium]|nr:hypothetical protein [bacterium]
MRILPLINASYDNKMNFKSGVIKSAGSVLTSPEVANTAKAVGGAVLVYLNVINSNKSSKNKKDDFQLRKLSEEEFETKKEDILSHTKDFKAFEYINSEGINEYNVQLFNYMLLNPETYNETYYRRLVDEMSEDFWAEKLNNEYSSSVALRMLKMPWFLRSTHDFARNSDLLPISSSATNKELRDIKLQMLDKLDEYKGEAEFSGMQESAIVRLLLDIKTEDGLKVALKLLEHPEILDSRSRFSKDCFGDFSNEKDFADIKIALIDKINSKPELFETKYFKDCIGGIFSNVTDDETKTLTLKVFDNPKLFESRDFAKYLQDILYHFSYTKKEEQEVVYKMLDAIEKKPELFKNEKFLNELGQLIFIQKDGDGVTTNYKKTVETGNKNLFLIEKGYYD